MTGVARAVAVRFAVRSPDGVDFAAWVNGEGPPLVSDGPRPQPVRPARPRRRSRFRSASRRSPARVWAAPRSWAEQSYPTLTYFNKVDRGGHFAAWEQPALFAAELRAAFKSLRASAQALR